ncbi:MAG: hypothetical protein ABI618_03005 [Nitrospirota bacterium]
MAECVIYFSGNDAGSHGVKSGDPSQTSFYGYRRNRMALHDPFFILAGASLELDFLRAASGLGIAYILLRLIGLIGGAWVGGTISAVPPAWRKWMGIALWPQAGVALGMALLASQHLPELKEVILPVAIGSTIVFELIGPVMTRKALIKVGEGQTHNEIGT